MNRIGACVESRRDLSAIHDCHNNWEEYKSIAIRVVRSSRAIMFLSLEMPFAVFDLERVKGETGGNDSRYFLHCSSPRKPGEYSGVIP